MQLVELTRYHLRHESQVENLMMVEEFHYHHEGDGDDGENL